MKFMYRQILVLKFEEVCRDVDVQRRQARTLENQAQILSYNIFMMHILQNGVNHTSYTHYMPNWRLSILRTL